MIRLELTEIDLTNIDEVLGDPEIDPQIKGTSINPHFAVPGFAYMSAYEC